MCPSIRPLIPRGPESLHQPAMQLKLSKPKPTKAFLEGVDIVCTLRRWEIISLGLLAACASACTASAACAVQLWDMTFARGCMLIVFDNSIQGCFGAGIAYIAAKTTAHELENDRKDRSAASRKAALVFVALCTYGSMYFLLVKNGAPLRAFTSCYVGSSKADICNIRASASSKKQSGSVSV